MFHKILIVTSVMSLLHAANENGYIHGRNVGKTNVVKLIHLFKYFGKKRII